MFLSDLEVHESVFLANGVQLVGKVEIGKDSSIWYNTVIRSDLNGVEVKIGERTNIQDGSCIHVDLDHSCIIGDDVTVGHNCILHACTIEDGTLIGMGAVILSGAHIKKGAVVGAGAVVRENTVVPENTLVVGIPAKEVRKLPEEGVKDNITHAREYSELAKMHM